MLFGVKWDFGIPLFKRKGNVCLFCCVCVQVGEAAWKSSLCAGAEHYGGLHHARQMPLRTHALSAGLSSAQPKNLRKETRSPFPRSAAAQRRWAVSLNPPPPPPYPSLSITPPPLQTATGLPPATQKPAAISLSPPLHAWPDEHIFIAPEQRGGGGGQVDNGAAEVWLDLVFLSNLIAWFSYLSWLYFHLFIIEINTNMSKWE